MEKCSLVGDAQKVDDGKKQRYYGSGAELLAPRSFDTGGNAKGAQNLQHNGKRILYACVGAVCHLSVLFAPLQPGEPSIKPYLVVGEIDTWYCAEQHAHNSLQLAHIALQPGTAELATTLESGEQHSEA